MGRGLERDGQSFVKRKAAVCKEEGRALERGGQRWDLAEHLAD